MQSLAALGTHLSGWLRLWGHIFLGEEEVPEVLVDFGQIHVLMVL
jgi:hypothetical protein